MHLKIEVNLPVTKYKHNNDFRLFTLVMIFFSDIQMWETYIDMWGLMFCWWSTGGMGGVRAHPQSQVRFCR